MNSTLIKRVIAILGLCLCLGLMNWKIVEKEEHLSTGQVVLLALAPVDPRSLMQGDFMALRYAMQTPIRQKTGQTNGTEKSGIDGLAWVSLAENNVAQLRTITLSDDPAPADAQDLTALQFRVRGGNVKLGSDAFFFQEGTGPAYEAAVYGKFRVNDSGELLLTSLVDKDFNVIDASGD